VYVGTDFEYLNPKGIIPAVAVFKKGENTGKSRREEGAVEAGPESDDEKAVAGEDG
jgi:tRNA pseudouridine38-40 synthase